MSKHKTGTGTSGGFRDVETLQTQEILVRFNEAFLRHDASLLKDLVAEDCVMESVEPAPDGTRYVGGNACLTFWQNLANDKAGTFDAEDIAAFANRGIIRWRYRFGPGLSESVRGVTVMQVREGRIMEALGYVKSGDASVANAVRVAAGSDNSPRARKPKRRLNP